MKIYLACGLPVFMTDVPAVARELAEKGAGVVVEHSPQALAEAVLRIFRDPEGYRRMRERALAAAREYDWDAVWERTFAETEKTV